MGCSSSESIRSFSQRKYKCNKLNYKELMYPKKHAYLKIGNLKINKYYMIILTLRILRNRGKIFLTNHLEMMVIVFSVSFEIWRLIFRLSSVWTSLFAWISWKWNLSVRTNVMSLFQLYNQSTSKLLYSYVYVWNKYCSDMIFGIEYQLDIDLNINLRKS